MTNGQLTDLPVLAAQINETQALAMLHAGKAVQYAVACGQLLHQAKAAVPHGQWLPWLRANVAFGERTAQGYMRIAHRLPNPQRVADMPLRRVLGELRTPLLSIRQKIDADLQEWMDHRAALDSNRSADPKDWSIEDAQACAASIRDFDMIMHRHGMCPWAGDPEPCCTVCDARFEGKD